MDEFEKFKRELLDKYQIWIKKFASDESRGRSAIDAIESIKVLRSREEFLYLSGDVTFACFKATIYDSPMLKDKAKETREEAKNVLEEIPDQLKAIKTLKRFISKYPFHSCNGFANAFKEINDETPLSKALDSESGKIMAYDFLLETLSLYEKGLDYEKEAIIQTNTEPLLFRRFSGYLLYPEPLNKREQGANEAENSLLFELAFLFKNFTNLELKKNWRFKIEGLLPEHGDPCYKHIANLANAVFYEDEDPNNEKKEFTVSKVGDRIRKLQQKGVQLYPSIVFSLQ